MRSSLPRAITTVTSLAVAAGTVSVWLTPSVAVAADVTPPTVTVSNQRGGSVGPFTVDFSEPVVIPDHSSVQFVESEDATNLPGALACTSGVIGAGFCQTWSFTPSEPTIMADNYDVYFQASPGTFADEAGNEMPQTFLSVKGTKRLGPNDPGLSFRWATQTISGTQGGTVTRERENGATFSYSFEGQRLVWYTMLGPNQGKADVKITRPGRRALFRSVDNQAAQVVKQAPIAFTDLGAGTHTITVTVAGDSTKHEANNQFVTLDALKVGKKTLDDPNVHYTWLDFDDARWTYQPNAQVTFQFRGSFFLLSGSFGLNAGQTEVFVDGSSWGVLDFYSTMSTYSEATVDGLADTKHTVTVVTLPSKNVDSTGHEIAVRHIRIY
jgi:hypothetical protein